LVHSVPDFVHSIPDFGSFRPRFWFIPSPILVHSVPDSGSFHPQSATGTKFLEATIFSWVSKQQEQELPLRTLLWSVFPNRILTERCFYQVSSANTFQPSKLTNETNKNTNVENERIWEHENKYRTVFNSAHAESTL
jgi:hypothetical protein